MTSHIFSNHEREIRYQKGEPKFCETEKVEWYHECPSSLYRVRDIFI